MSWTPLVLVLCVAVAPPAYGSTPLLPPGPTACTAPSGRAGDCLLSEDCPASRRPMSTTPCGYNPGRDIALLYCCEPKAEAPSGNDSAGTDGVPPPPPRTLPTDCGISYGVSGGISIGLQYISPFNKVARERAWPWTALIGLAKRDDRIGWVCGGALISTQHVLTSAHCLPRTNGTKVEVRVGENDLLARRNKKRQQRKVWRIVKHANFNVSQHDLALVTLDSPVHLDSSVQPICLPEQDRSLVDLYGYLTIWDKLQYHPHNAVQLLPKEKLLQLDDPSNCEALYNESREYFSRFPNGFRGDVLCAKDPMQSVADGGSLRESRACRQDAGWPLSVKLNHGRYVVAGLVLEDMACNNFANSKLFTSIGSYVDWIHSEVAFSHDNWLQSWESQSHEGVF